jgi:hypothetical protein
LTDDPNSTTNTTSDDAAWHIDDTGRRRYRGSLARHRQSSSAVELQDLDTALAELAAARAMLAEAEQIIDFRERREVRKTAFAKVGLASRFAAEIAGRRP